MLTGGGMRRFVVAYALANAAAVTLAGAVTCGIQLDWPLGVAVLAIALATLQSALVRHVGARPLFWWSLTVAGVVAATPLGFTAVYLLAVVLLGGAAALGLPESLAGPLTLVVLTAPVALGGVIIAAAQSPALPRPRDRYLVPWIAGNAVAGLLGAPALENVLFRCYPTGIAPPWFEATPIGWIVTGAVAGALTGYVLARCRARAPDAPAPDDSDRGPRSAGT
jgi:hypothetical protein